MSKIESYKQHIIPLIEAYFNSNNSQKLTKYFIANSNLPGPRANLELANAFADVIQDYSKRDGKKLWQLCSEYIKISSNETPTNDLKEFIPFQRNFSKKNKKTQWSLLLNFQMGQLQL